MVEEYALDVPRDVHGPLKSEAKLRYLAYPTSFATLMDLAPAPTVDVAAASLELGKGL